MSTILTEQQFSEALDVHFAEKKRRYMERFRIGAQRYGACDLDAKDWIKERQEEADDQEIYGIFEVARVRRLATKLAAHGAPR